MAKVTFGTTVSDMRQRIGNVVYARNRGGSYARALNVLNNPKSPAQNAVRANMIAVAALWASGLSAAQRSAWGDFATGYPRRDQFAQAITLSGFGAFVACARNLASAGLPPNLDPPQNLYTLCPAAFSATADLSATGLTIDTLDNLLDANHSLEVWATKRLNSGRTFMSPFLRMVGVFTGPIVLPLDFTAAYLARFPLGFASNGNVGIAIKALNHITGATSPRILRTIPAIGGDMLLSTQRTFTPAEIQNLLATPIQLLPAPGAGKMHLPIAANFNYTHGAVPFANAAAQNLLIDAAGNPNSAGLLMDASEIGQILHDSIWWDDRSATHDDRTIFLNQNITLSQQGPLEYTGGDGTFRITLYYVTLTP